MVKKFPQVKRAVTLLLGAPVAPGFKLPERFENGTEVDWARVEKYLATLTSAELETFCNGEQEDWVGKRTADFKYANRAVQLLYVICIGG
jgi:hypothetical protein